VSYNTIIDGLCKKGEINKVELPHDMISRKHHPDVVTYNTLIDGLGARMAKLRRQINC
jgi:leucine-rich PPR motif-containing protein, mitochondrial